MVRERLGLKREELAVRTGLSWSAIAQIETGRRVNLRPGTVRALAEALDVTTDYLLGSVDTRLLEHHALLYSDEGEFVEAATSFIADGVKHSEPVFAVTDKN